MIDETHFPGRQGRLLFAYLVAEAGRAVPRDELAEALWAEAPPATWDKALSVIVSKLRALLADRGIDGNSALTGAFGCYRLELPEETWVDVLAATDSAHKADHAIAQATSSRRNARPPWLRHCSQPFSRRGRCVGRGEATRVRRLRGRALTRWPTHPCVGRAREAVQWAEQTIALAPFRETDTGA